MSHSYLRGASCNMIALEGGSGFLWSLEDDGTLYKTDKPATTSR